MDQLEKDIQKGVRKVENWANTIGVSTIDIGYKNTDPFFNINTKKDFEEALKILNNYNL